MLVYLAVLQASWLLGPPPAHRVELYLAPSYAQAPAGRAQPELRYQRMRLQAGFAYTVDDQHTVHVDLPLTAARHESDRGVEYRDRDLGDAVFGIQRWLDTHWHAEVDFVVPLGQEIDPDIYPESAASMPALGTGRTRVLFSGGWTQRAGGLAVALSAGADVGLDRVTIAPVIRGSGLWVLMPDALEVGGFADAKWGLDEADERWLRVGLMERVGPAIGLSGELTVSTMFATQHTEAATEAGLRFVWRR